MELTDRDQKEGGSGAVWKEGEGTSQRTRRNNPWELTTVWELTVAAGVEWKKGSKGSKIGTTVIE